jgi:LPXTG-motif cell wall-anchored protein
VTPRATQTVTHTPTPTPTPTATVTPTASVTPTAAPVTGGGGTAGFQDTLLLVAGVAAIVAGAGSIFYRRRVNRGR